MANNTSKKEEAKQAMLQKKKEQAYRVELKRINAFPFIGLGLLAAALLLFFARWLAIFNSDIPGIEIGVNGFSAAICALTGNYTLPDGIYGMMAAFYYWAPEPCQPFATAALLSLCSLIVGLVIYLIAGLKKAHALDAAGACFSVISAICAIVSFAYARSMEPDMIAGYCSGNPACSLQSNALLPAVAALAAAAVGIFAFVKYLGARKRLQ